MEREERGEEEAAPPRWLPVACTALLDKQSDPSSFVFGTNLGWREECRIAERERHTIVVPASVVRLTDGVIIVAGSLLLFDANSLPQNSAGGRTNLLKFV